MCFFKAFRERVLGDLEHLHTHVVNIEQSQQRNLEADMATNDELVEIGSKLDEAATELGGLPAQIEELLAQVGDQADPALVASIKAKAQALADIVPNPPVDGGEVPVDPEPAPE